MKERQSLEPNGLPSPKAHLCAYGYSILKNALKRLWADKSPVVTGNSILPYGKNMPF
jgi:hypothetical protein